MTRYLKDSLLRTQTMASMADKHQCYHEAVQNVRHEIDNLVIMYNESRPERDVPLVLREDFCGTAILCRQWVQRHVERSAIGLDIDQDVLSYARSLCPSDRIQLIQVNVLEADLSSKADIIV